MDFRAKRKRWILVLGYGLWGGRGGGYTFKSGDGIGAGYDPVSPSDRTHGPSDYGNDGDGGSNPYASMLCAIRD